MEGEKVEADLCCTLATTQSVSAGKILDPAEVRMSFKPASQVGFTSEILPHSAVPACGNEEQCNNYDSMVSFLEGGQRKGIDDFF